MSLFFTVAEETPLVQKVWNLVDWLITAFDFSVGVSIAANIYFGLCTEEKRRTFDKNKSAARSYVIIYGSAAPVSLAQASHIQIISGYNKRTGVEDHTSPYVGSAGGTDLKRSHRQSPHVRDNARHTP